MIDDQFENINKNTFGAQRLLLIIVHFKWELYFSHDFKVLYFSHDSNKI